MNALNDIIEAANNNNPSYGGTKVSLTVDPQTKLSNYNKLDINNKFKSINEIYSFSTKIDEANYICIKDIDDNNIIDVSEEENREKLKKFFDNIRIRESKLKLIDKEQEIDYTIFIYLPENEYFVNIKNSEIMINNKIYETDIKIDSYLSEIFEDE